MTVKKQWSRPLIEYLGSPDCIEKRIESLQKHIEIYRKKYMETGNSEDYEILKTYQAELNRVQVKYKFVLQHAHN